MSGENTSTAELPRFDEVGAQKANSDLSTMHARSSNVDSSRIARFWIDPFRQHHSNGCAQAMMATALVYWGKAKCDAKLPYQLVTDIRSKPDIAAGLFGTSWERITKVLQAFGLRAWGQNIPDNKPASVQQMLDNLGGYTARGVPVCVLLGNGELDNQFGAHWWLLVDITPSHVVLENGGSTFQTFPLGKFIDAWRADGLPWVHYAAVLAIP